ncbi:MAG TPA: hypothetical protein VFN97_23700 [Actinospica sp.]|nr:hypothetical protein [Actinospica sp.]
MRTDTTTSVTSSKSGVSATAGQRSTRAPRPAAASAGSRYRTVHDRVALDEIELYAELIIAAERSEEPLSQEAIDRILGLTIRA